MSARWIFLLLMPLLCLGSSRLLYPPASWLDLLRSGSLLCAFGFLHVLLAIGPAARLSSAWRFLMRWRLAIALWAAGLLVVHLLTLVFPPFENAHFLPAGWAALPLFGAVLLGLPMLGRKSVLSWNVIAAYVLVCIYVLFGLVRDQPTPGLAMIMVAGALGLAVLQVLGNRADRDPEPANPNRPFHTGPLAVCLATSLALGLGFGANQFSFGNAKQTSRHHHLSGTVHIVHGYPFLEVERQGAKTLLFLEGVRGAVDGEPLSIIVPVSYRDGLTRVGKPGPQSSGERDVERPRAPDWEAPTLRGEIVAASTFLGSAAPGDGATARRRNARLADHGRPLLFVVRDSQGYRKPFLLVTKPKANLKSFVGGTVEISGGTIEQHLNIPVLITDPASIVRVSGSPIFKRK